jgi:hypothetical protein
MKFYQLIVSFACSIAVLSAFTDPSLIHPELVKRFEYKLSFKGPHLSFKDGTVPFWTHGGSKSFFFAERSSSSDRCRSSGAIASDDQVRVTPSIRSQKGRIWSKNTMTADNWLLEVKIRVNGRGRVGADGMVSDLESSDRIIQC